MYAESQRLIKKAESSEEPLSDNELSLIADMRLSQVILEEAVPEYAARYKMEKAMWETFTYEQRDFICAQIGHWYLMWKENMATGEGTQHRLGAAKEQLKMMICGD
jgi:hypothetical protein